MGKPTGFKEFDRALPKKVKAAERKKNYNEFIQFYSSEELHRQSARCMDCGVPFCQSGCPLGNVIPEFNDAVYQGKWEEAYKILSSTNNFPEFTGRICPAPCESACVLSINKPPVAIEEIEKHIIEIAFKRNYVKPHVAPFKTGKRVAVVGSGPAGLAAAAQLTKVGHDVVVYEKDDKAGGLLQYGIPDFKLEKWVIERRIAMMEEEGVVFKYNANVGGNVPLSELRAYDAVVLAGGSSVPHDMKLPGRHLKGIHFAMDYLTQQNKRIGNSPITGEEIYAEGKHVIVIGDGDTGSDCIGTANRQGAKSVTQFARKNQLPADRNSHTPWPTYPKIHRTTSSHEEGCERLWRVKTKEYLGDENGHLRAVLVADLEWQLDDRGHPVGSKEIEGTERELPCDLLFLATGFAHPLHEGLVQDLNLELDHYGNVKADNKEFATSAEKIFVAGDMRMGQSLVVWAISEGRECARKVDQFLMGMPSELESKDAVYDWV